MCVGLALPIVNSQNMLRTDTQHAQLIALLGSNSPTDWEAVRVFCSRLPQSRRKLRTHFENLQADLRSRQFSTRRMAWRRRGLTLCRHGVFFARAQGRTCPCLTPHVSEDTAWQHARFMPSLAEHIRALVVVRFDRHTYGKLGILPTRMRCME